jgi:hypothetical protein
MFELYSQLSKAVDVFNERVVESEVLEYHEVLDMLENKHDENEVMALIIKLYSMVH